MLYEYVIPAFSSINYLNLLKESRKCLTLFRSHFTSKTQFEIPWFELWVRSRRNGDAPTRQRRRKQAAWIRARSRPSKREIIYARNLSFYQLFSIFFFAITLKTLKIENNWAQFWIFTSNHHSSTCQKLNLNKLV